MKDADIYESAKERIRAVLPVPDSSRAILATIHLKRSAIGGVDREAVEVLLATLDRLAADLLEARREIAAGMGQPEGGLPGWEWDAKNSRWFLLLPGGSWGHVRGSRRPEWGWFWWSTALDRGGYVDTPRAAMRAAEEALRAGGLL